MMNDTGVRITSPPAQCFGFLATGSAGDTTGPLGFINRPGFVFETDRAGSLIPAGPVFCSSGRSHPPRCETCPSQ